MKFKKILKTCDDGNRHVFGLSDSDIVLISNLVQAKLLLAKMEGNEIDDGEKKQLETIMDEFTKAINTDEAEKEHE